MSELIEALAVKVDAQLQGRVRRVAALDTALRDVALDAVGMTVSYVRAGTAPTGVPVRFTYDGSTLTVYLPMGSPL